MNISKVFNIKLGNLRCGDNENSKPSLKPLQTKQHLEIAWNV